MMKGEFTRNTFRRDRHYSGVRLLQGRVFMDADHNESQDIAAHRDRTTAADVIGPDGAPDLGGGFRLSASARLNSLDLAGAAGRAVGGRGTVLASADGGVTWTAQALPAAQQGVNLLGVDVIDASHAFAVGEGGTILAHDGTAWTPRTAADAAGRRLRGVHFTTAQAGWVVGDGGLLLGTADGGATWAKRTAAGVTETLRGVHFPDATHGWAVGDGGRIVATVDGGATWAVQPPPSGVTANLNAVRFADATRGWAVGDGATVLSTTDGGATWTARRAPAGVAAALRGVDAASTATVWAAGDGGTVLRSTDGGANWTQLAFPEGAILTSVRVTAAAVATVAGDLSTIARVTVAGGGAVTVEPVPRPHVARDLAISAGRIYVDGLLCENERPLSYLGQPDYPGASVPATPGTRMAYLDVWTRHLTALDRAEMREVALGGPDTATRTQTVWQVRLEDPVVPDGTTCPQIVPGWAPPEGPGTGRMRARSSPAAIAVNDCMVPAGGGYRRLENQLYRVEIFKAGAAGAASYVWSRDNGAVTARLVATDPAATAMTVTLSDAGRDAVGGFAGAPWIELTDDRRILRGLRGELLRVQSVIGKVVKVQDVPPAMSQFSAGAIVRRWDGTGDVKAGGWDTLGTEEGVQVEFSGGDYRTGDYWTVPARSLTGDVEWPRQAGTPVFQAREGTEHHHCPLALVRVGADGSLEVVSDCRAQFTALVRQTHLHMAGGDGQEVMPPPGGGLATLPAPLQVAVVNGPRPVNGAKVRFTVTDANDRLDGAGTTTTATTGAGGVPGIAGCAWALSTAAASHQVVAQLLDPDGTAVGPELHFDAGFSVARQVAYDPSAASDMAGMFTVQDAIDRLSRRSGGVCTVNVRPGDDVQAAVEALPADGGELCFAAGDFKLTDPLHVTKRGRVTITGRGPSTVLRCGHEVVAVIKECQDIEVSHLRVEAGGMGTAPGEEHIMGALTFLDCIEIDVHDCELACPDAAGGRAQACLTVHGHGDGRIAERARIHGNRLETGVGQVGMLVAEPRLAEITGNHVVPSWSATQIATHIPPKRPNPFTDGDDPRAIQQGIVIGGANIGVARISDNVLERVIQGIHVGAATGGEADRKPGFAVQVSLSRNVIYSVVEAGYRRERHAIFVGSAFSVTITDTFAYCARPGDGDHTEMDAIRVIGQLGEYALVRGSHLTGYGFGVRLQPRPDPGEAALPHSMWLVAETFARDAQAAFVGSVAVRTENNVAV
jgi:photosystem II stability/assembly factor-like uncharacterized protein